MAVSEEEEFEFRARLEREQAQQNQAAQEDRGLLSTIDNIARQGPLAAMHQSFAKNPEPYLNALPGAGMLIGTPLGPAASGAFGGAGEALKQIGRKAAGLNPVTDISVPIPFVHANIPKMAPIAGNPLQTLAERGPISAAKQVYSQSPAIQNVVAQMATPLALEAITQLGAAGVQGLARNVSIPAARRVLGFTKALLPNKMARQGANEAAEIALQRGMIGPTKSTETMYNEAEQLGGQAGQGIGHFLKNAPNSGQIDVNGAIERLEQLRARSSTTGQILNQGHFAENNQTIDKAIETIKSFERKALYFDDFNKIKGTLQDVANYMSKTGKGALDRQVAGTVRSYIDEALNKFASQAGPEMATKVAKFFEDRKLYGAAERMKTALNNRLSSEWGNNVIGLRNAGAAAVQLGLGNPIRAAETLGAIKLSESKGLKTLAPLAYKLSKTNLSGPAKAALISAIVRRQKQQQQKDNK